MNNTNSFPEKHNQPVITIHPKLSWHTPVLRKNLIRDNTHVPKNGIFADGTQGTSFPPSS